MRTVLRRTEAIYHHQECGCELCSHEQTAVIEAIDIAGWMKVMEQLAQDVYEGKTDSQNIDPAYIASMYNELNTAAGKGYGKNWTKVNKETGNISPEVVQMQRNLYKFSGAKSTVVLEEINQILQKQLPWKQFRDEVLKLNPKYNKNYLQAEWQTANQSAKHAKDWLYYKDNSALYPNLAYRTQGDEKVRDAHALLNGVIAPINSDFWKSHYPPNGWRCRCFVVQTAEPSTQIDKIPTLSDKDFPEEFRINVGESGQVFSEGNLKDSKAHPYFALAKNDDWKKSYELAKLAAPANEVFSSGKNTVKVSPFADEKDLKENIDDAKVIAKEAKVNVEIKAHVDSTILLGHKNPEYIIDDITADRKAPTTDKVKNLRNIYKSATKQECEALVLNLGKTALKFEDVKAEVEKKFKTFPNIKTVYIIDKNGDCTIMQKEPNK